MPYYEWRQPDDPESEAQHDFVNSYIREHFGSGPDAWTNGVSHSLTAYWRTQGVYDDPEEGAFFYPFSAFTADTWDAAEELMNRFPSVAEDIRKDARIKDISELQFSGHITGEEARLKVFKLYDTNRKSILDALGSWKSDRPLQDVQKLRDQYRKELLEDLSRKDHSE